MYIPFPNFHCAALAVKLSYCVFYDTTMVHGSNAPLTADVATAFHEVDGVKGSFLAPSLLRDMIHDPRALESLRKLDYVGYGKMSSLTFL